METPRERLSVVLCPADGSAPSTLVSPSRAPLTCSLQGSALTGGPPLPLRHPCLRGPTSSLAPRPASRSPHQVGEVGPGVEPLGLLTGGRVGDVLQAEELRDGDDVLLLQAQLPLEDAAVQVDALLRGAGGQGGRALRRSPEELAASAAAAGRGPALCSGAQRRRLVSQAWICQLISTGPAGSWCQFQGSVGAPWASILARVGDPGEGTIGPQIVVRPLETEPAVDPRAPPSPDQLIPNA